MAIVCEEEKLGQLFKYKMTAGSFIRKLRREVLRTCRRKGRDGRLFSLGYSQIILYRELNLMYFSWPAALVNILVIRSPITPCVPSHLRTIAADEDIGDKDATSVTPEDFQRRSIVETNDVDASPGPRRRARSQSLIDASSIIEYSRNKV